MFAIIVFILNTEIHGNDTDILLWEDKIILKFLMLSF